MSIILPNLNHSFISPVPIPVPVPDSGSGSRFPAFPYAHQIDDNAVRRLIYHERTSFDFGELVVMIGLVQQQKWQNIAEERNKAKEPIVVIVLEVCKKPDEISINCNQNILSEEVVCLDSEAQCARDTVLTISCVRCVILSIRWRSSTHTFSIDVSVDFLVHVRCH